MFAQDVIVLWCCLGLWKSFVAIWRPCHYNDVIMSTIASQTTSLTIVYSTVYSGADQRKHQGSASLAFVRGIHRWPGNSPHKGLVTRKIFKCDDVIMDWITANSLYLDKHRQRAWINFNVKGPWNFKASRHCGFINHGTYSPADKCMWLTIMALMQHFTCFTCRQLWMRFSYMFLLSEHHVLST